jgi:prolyl-tRNA synthetase
MANKKNALKEGAKMPQEITKKEEEYSKWYRDIIRDAGLAENSGVKGCMVIKPYGYAI